MSRRKEKHHEITSLALELVRAALRAPCHGHQVDAVAVAVAVGDVVPQVRAVHADGLAVRQAAHVLPDHLLVPEAGPAVRAALLLELLEGAADGRAEERLTRDAVVIRGRLLAVDLLEELGLEPVARVLGVVAVEAADVVRRLEGAAPPQVLLRRPGAGAVLLLGHDLLRRNDGEGLARGGISGDTHADTEELLESDEGSPSAGRLGDGKRDGAGKRQQQYTTEGLGLESGSGLGLGLGLRLRL
eukprot:CAMPEP_0118853576 /NCGR_PEP_ID=MMETSP1163-20130328/2108_1 /TAXON_ID=124430 /ORGANISM="Phaeomonas parva, Strain CCMP2877" /LENGTH=243 /DNA_ID=CAMNT_0006786147 /DNA_START=61 /DNA_END=792 /DNA_ORIENTATION=-